MSGTYADLKVWQRAMELVYRVYEVTRNFPKDELYGLISQMRRAAVSIPSNIAEGKGRSSRKDPNVFLCHARGSLHELETQVLIAQHLGYLNQPDAAHLTEHCKEIGRMRHGFIDFAAPSQN